MNKVATLLVAGGVALSLVGCGARDEPLAGGEGTVGGEAPGGTPEPPAEASVVRDVRVLSDVNRIETGGSDVANITALVTDAGNRAVAEQTVSFSASGGVLQGVSESTDENGVARATLRLLQDFRTQDITVSVSADEVTGEAVVSADGSELEVSGPTNLIEGASAEIIAVLKAGNGEPIVNEPILIESSAGNTISPASATTDIDGRITVNVGSTNGDDTVRLSALESTVSASHPFSVSSDTLTIDGIDVDTELEVGLDHAVTVTWTSGGSPVAGEALRFATTAGNIVGERTILTDATGEAVVTLRSSSAGTARLTVEDALDGEPSAYADAEFVASTPARVEVDASSSRVAVLGTSTVTALVTDANGNPVKGSEVVFGSADLKGGQLNPASATTGNDGEASVTFTAGPNATEIDEIAIEAEVEGGDLVDSMLLSVVERSLNITIGTANKVANDGSDGPVQYWLDFVVQVADGSGAPLDGADVALSIQPLSYRKGFLSRVDENGVEFDGTDPNWTHAGYALGSHTVVCAAEDDNGNRILDPGEDDNGNGVLDPQDPASLVASLDGVATLSGDSLTTDATGSGYFRMIYPVSSAQWAQVRIIARAQGLGAESRDFFDTGLPVLASEVNQNDFTPANYLSPFGTKADAGQADCANEL